jgi:hypothetical protein
MDKWPCGAVPVANRRWLCRRCQLLLQGCEDAPQGLFMGCQGPRQLQVGETAKLKLNPHLQPCLIPVSPVEILIATW